MCKHLRHVDLGAEKLQDVTGVLGVDRPWNDPLLSSLDHMALSHLSAVQMSSFQTIEVNGILADFEGGEEFIQDLYKRYNLLLDAFCDTFGPQVSTA